MSKLVEHLITPTKIYYDDASKHLSVIQKCLEFINTTALN